MATGDPARADPAVVVSTAMISEAGPAIMGDKEISVEVADADLDTLQSLVEKSLLRFTGGRCWMLETIREYAAERLERSGDAQELRELLMAGAPEE